MNAFDESGLTPLTQQQAREISAYVDLDVRLFPLYTELWEAEQVIDELKNEDVQMVLAAAIRAAYHKGYTDRAQEVPQQPGQYASQLYYT